MSLDPSKFVYVSGFSSDPRFDHSPLVVSDSGERVVIRISRWPGFVTTAASAAIFVGGIVFPILILRFGNQPLSDLVRVLTILLGVSFAAFASCFYLGMWVAYLIRSKKDHPIVSEEGVLRVRHENCSIDRSEVRSLLVLTADYFPKEKQRVVGATEGVSRRKMYIPVSVLAFEILRDEKLNWLHAVRWSGRPPHLMLALAQHFASAARLPQPTIKQLGVVHHIDDMKPELGAA
jgi:hypothetical protein